MKNEENKENKANKIWWYTSLMLIFTVVPIVIVSVKLGEPRSIVFGRVVNILYPIVTFFLGLLIGIKYMYRIKTKDLYTEDEVKELKDGVTEVED